MIMRGAVEKLVGATQILLITTSDSTEYDPPLRAISIGTAGTLAVVTTADPNAVTIPANCLATGQQHFGQFKKIMTTGTTASEIVGWR